MVKQVKFNRADRDYAWYIDGELMGFAPSYQLAQQAADDYVYATLTRSNTSAADLTPEDAAAVAAVVNTAAPAPSLTNITRENVAAVVARAKQAAAEHTRWVNAITRAADELEKNQWLFTGSTLKIHSRTRRRTYTVSGAQCSCEASTAGQPCYHVAAWRILTRAAQPGQVAA